MSTTKEAPGVDARLPFEAWLMRDFGKDAYELTVNERKLMFIAWQAAQQQGAATDKDQTGTIPTAPPKA